MRGQNRLEKSIKEHSAILGGHFSKSKIYKRFHFDCRDHYPIIGREVEDEILILLIA